MKNQYRIKMIAAAVEKQAKKQRDEERRAARAAKRDIRREYFSTHENKEEDFIYI